MMYKAVKKSNKPEESRAAANSIFQKKNHPKGGLGVVDNRPGPAATRLTSAPVGPVGSSTFIRLCAPSPLFSTIRPSSAAKKVPPIQRVIKTKTGYIDDSDSKILIIQPPVVQDMMRSRDTYLMQSTKDMYDYRTGKRKDVPVLTPHKHLIGEEHDKSQFNQAVNDWGFGAPQMREGLNIHPQMRDTTTEERVLDPNDEAFQAKPLESSLAKAIGELLLFKERLDQLVKAIGLFKQQKAFMEKSPSEMLTLGLRMGFKNLVNFSGVLLGRWPEFDWTLKLAVNYVKSVDESELGQLPQGVEIKTQIVDKAETINKISSKVQEYLRTQNTSIDEELHIDDRYLYLLDEKVVLPRLQLFQKVLVSELGGIAEELGASSVLERGIGVQSGFKVMSPSREYFMGINIANGIDAPSLIQVGDSHIPGLLRQGIPQTRGYESYQEFEKATRNVLPS